MRAGNDVWLAAGGFCLAIWLYLVFLHGRFWRLGGLQLQRPKAPGAERRVVAIIPARNEADVIGHAVASLLNQRGVSIHLFVVDDNSDDETAEVVRRAAELAVQTGSVTVVEGRPLPPGWSGKLWAVQQGIEQAVEVEPDFLLLTDADIKHGPDMLARLVTHAEAGQYDLASLMVKLHCRSVAEKLLIPAFMFFFFMLYPSAWVGSSRRRVAGAAGGCMLIRPEALERAGGIASIRSEIIDDCALARAVKRSDGRVWLGTTRETHSLRAYESFREIERMIARTAFNQLRHSTLLLGATVLGLVLTYLLPLALVFSGHWGSALAGGVAWALMSAAYLPMVRFYGLNPMWSLTLPASAVFYMAATLHSAMKFWTGCGGEWKGRAQDVQRV